MSKITYEARKLLKIWRKSDVDSLEVDNNLEGIDHVEEGTKRKRQQRVGNNVCNHESNHSALSGLSHFLES